MDEIFPLLSALLLQLFLKFHPLLTFALSLLSGALILHGFVVFLKLKKRKGVLKLIFLIFLIVIAFVVENILVLSGLDEMVDLFTLHSIAINKFLTS